MANIRETGERAVGTGLLAVGAVLLVVMPVEGTTALRNMLFLTLLLLALWHFRPAGPERRSPRPCWPLLGWWGAYALIAVGGLYWAVDYTYSLKEVVNEVLFPPLFFWLGANLFRDRRAWRWLAGGIVAGNLLLVGYCLAVWLSGGTTKGHHMIGSYRTGPGNFSTYLVTVLPILALLAAQAFRSRAWRRAAWLGLLLLANFAAMYATKNRLVFVAVAMQVVVVAAYFARHLRRPRYLLPVVALIICLGALFLAQSSHRLRSSSLAQSADVEAALNRDGRLPVWKFAIAEALRHPLHGGGMGRNTFSHLYPAHPLAQPPFDHAHNMLVNRLVQLGLPGLLAFVALLGGLVGLLLRAARHSRDGGWLALAGLAICAGVFAKSMTDDFFVRELGYMFWLLGGALLGIESASAKTEEQ